MRFTIAATVRFRSESWPLGSRGRAVARRVKMELPPMRSRETAGPPTCARRALIRLLQRRCLTPAHDLRHQVRGDADRE
jgi:hypothetical protein